ncbi:hypothetical protein LAC81_37330 (plasmid) [Ensifer adhaerens]|uniref:hypothetical protein n=1 Tax=Ensifer adhaerens TaxID=106592 RepID=UPI001CC0E022|nr:hypothetical protein [Ensifer adhaerens]MBZ7927604.1 hypothetical protein [Ensifer adhaerens]UAX98008.1 hypothetical protein LAC78_38635 [Ensifer adhaerens]UAY05388.1 hypothetical protein LAC80_37345 [Ensifer adhaerens]UAY12766.1 hypothetical protein LAC81_37330 [Ensifer adhaerens]
MIGARKKPTGMMRASQPASSRGALQGDNPSTSGSGQFLPQTLSMTSFRPASCSVNTWMYRADKAAQFGNLGTAHGAQRGFECTDAP